VGTPRTGPLPTAGGSELERIRRIVGALFPIYDTRLGPQSLILAVQVDPGTLEVKFDRLRRELWAAGYVPILRHQMGEHYLEVIPRPKLRAKRQWINLALLGATVVTCTFAGALIWLTNVLISWTAWTSTPQAASARCWTGSMRSRRSWRAGPRSDRGWRSITQTQGVDL